MMKKKKTAMQSKPHFVTTNELHTLAQRYQRVATALTRLAGTAQNHPMLLKLGTLRGIHLAKIEDSLSRVSSDGARQVLPSDEELGRSLLT
jgi:hypothetical protein